ncbi:hypothetical protein [Hymenobacter cheonanensis]|uniref:hypothetical protein n=1 Tax=Hymenobacter sp. CA2-7 TaxID=3063993 RepID=UPI00271244C8|nr:hypothetical protein [Hymenobacter sp. CA2-7]MDO7884251.1 hypothetical protein [Hymenobacter sp. CA2-7]
MLRGGYFNYESRFIASLPLPAINLQHDKVVLLVEQLTTGYAALPGLTLPTAREQAQAHLRQLERRLDALVYMLYGLTEAEIAHISALG